MTFKLWRFKFGVRWEDTHPSTNLWVGRSLRFFLCYETDRLRLFRLRVKEAINARKTNAKRGVGQTTNDGN